MTNLAEPILINQPTAARMLSLSQSGLRKLSSPNGPIPVVRLGRSVRYDVADLRRVIAASKKA